MTHHDLQEMFGIDHGLSGQTLFKIRAHQLLCLLTWKGIAYTPQFKAVFDIMVKTIQRGNAVLEILVREEPSTYSFGSNAPPSRFLSDRDMIALEEIRNNTGLPLQDGSRFRLDRPILSSLRNAFKKSTIRGACHDCGFHDMCTRIAEGGFSESMLNPSAMTPPGPGRQ